MNGIRLVVVDDNPHLRWNGRTHPVNATFHRFLATMLDVPGRPIAAITHVVPLREATVEPRTLPLDERIEVVGSAPFDGIAGYLRHVRSISRTNGPILQREIEAADLVWIKVPGSNALLAARIARRTATPRFGWVAGSARQVAAARWRNPAARLATAVVGAGYDVAGRLAAGRHRIVVGDDVVSGDGVIASLVELDEVRPADRAWEPHRPPRLGWAGRVADGKGLTRLLDALAALPEAELLMLGDGPARAGLEALARGRGLAGRIDWRGHVAERRPYLDELAAADIFVHPSPAEGFPKVVLDAMAVGLPVAAVPAGGLADLGRARLIRPIVKRSGADPVAYAVMALLRERESTQAMRLRATEFATEHVAPAEALRLVRRLRTWFPDLPWSETA
jgi:glycosyltransferase involved in cell wall biosynthesis